jgi:hypothetical protein
MKFDATEQFPGVRFLAVRILECGREKHQGQRTASPPGAQAFHFQCMPEICARKRA